VKRLTRRQTIKHADGTEHIETYCHGHRYGPAAFPHKYGTSCPREYKNYCAMIDVIAAYKDTGISPAEIVEMQAADKRREMNEYLLSGYISTNLCPAEISAMHTEYAAFREAEQAGTLIRVPLVKDSMVIEAFAHLIAYAISCKNKSLQEELMACGNMVAKEYNKHILPGGEV
jgi:hypothetical protein